MPKRKFIRGISAVGERVDDADVSYGKTTKEGVVITFNTNELVAESGQDQFPIDVEITSAGVEAALTLVFADLRTAQRALGLPVDALSGDLEAQEPSDEVLEVAANALGSRPASAYYIDTPGRGPGKRRYLFPNAKMLPTGSITLGRDAYLEWPVKIVALATEDGTAPFTITDAAA